MTSAADVTHIKPHSLRTCWSVGGLKESEDGTVKGWTTMKTDDELEVNIVIVHKTPENAI